MKMHVSRKRPKPYVLIERGKFRIVNEYGEVIGFGRMPESWPPPGIRVGEDKVHVLQIAGTLGKLVCEEHGHPMEPIDFDAETDGPDLGAIFMAKAVELLQRQGGTIHVPWRDRATWGIAGPSSGKS